MTTTTTTTATTPAATTLGGAAAATNGVRPAASSAGGFGGDFQTFLTLLTTQLQNQDPTNAMSPETMTAQLVQFAQVEQQIRVNDSLQTLIGLQQAAQLTAAAPLLGRTVEVETDQLVLKDGKATLRLPATPAGTTAVEATVRILDSAGRTLREQPVTLGPQPKNWTWDGKDGRGTTLDDGVYRFVATTPDRATGALQPVDATVRAVATGAERRNGTLSLMLGDLAVGFDKVRSLSPAD
jgi:flagellar basal-body rod modification protein FlgD